MVLGHQGFLSNMSGGPQGLQPSALQLAAVAAHLAPRSRVPPWAPFLQFGMPNLFGNNPFLTRPHFGVGPPNIPQSLINMNGSTGSSHSSISPSRNLQSPPSEDSNDERGELIKPYRRMFISQKTFNPYCCYCYSCHYR